MTRGQTLSIKIVRRDLILFDGLEPHYLLGPTSVGHDHHRPLRAGDVLLVRKDSAVNGDTLATMPCRCDVLLIAS